MWILVRPSKPWCHGQGKGEYCRDSAASQGLEGEIPTPGSPKVPGKGKNGRGSIQIRERWELKGNSQFQGSRPLLGSLRRCWILPCASSCPAPIHEHTNPIHPLRNCHGNAPGASLWEPRLGWDRGGSSHGKWGESPPTAALGPQIHGSHSSSLPSALGPGAGSRGDFPASFLPSLLV